MPRNQHASVVNDMLASADEDTWECARCGDLHLDRGEALRCCSDPDDDGQGGEPA